MSEKYPAEVLGFASQDCTQIESAIANELPCPFMKEPCTKKNGVCSVHANDMVVVICPNRFLQQNRAIMDIAREHFGSIHDLLVFKDVYSGDPNLGSFSYVIVQHHLISREIRDFVIVEFHSVDVNLAEKTEQAVEDFEQGLDFVTRYSGFDLESRNIWPQVLNIDHILTNGGHKAF